MQPPLRDTFLGTNWSSDAGFAAERASVAAKSAAILPVPGKHCSAAVYGAIAACGSRSKTTRNK
jgi:hypothetical protein